MAAEPKSPEDPGHPAPTCALSKDGALASDRSDAATGMRSPEPGDADVNLNQEGRFGNLQQNLTSRRQVMEQ